MNFINQSTPNGATTDVGSISDNYLALDQATVIIREYVNRVICGCGILLNIGFQSVLLDKRLRFRAYSYLWARTVCNLLVCLIGVFQLPKYKLNEMALKNYVTTILLLSYDPEARIFPCPNETLETE